MDDSKLVELTKENMKLKAKIKKLEKELEINSIEFADTELRLWSANKYLQDRSDYKDDCIRELKEQREDHTKSISFLEDMVERQEAQIKDLREVARLLSRAYSSDPSDLV